MSKLAEYMCHGGTFTIFIDIRIHDIMDDVIMAKNKPKF